MDESWRINFGSKLPRRKSAEETLDYGGNYLDPDEFKDVFGGPPRSVIFRQKIDAGISCRQFPGNPVQRVFDSDNSSIYEEIFQPISDRQLRADPGLLAFDITARRSRNLPIFKIPAASEVSQGNKGFYGDIFRIDDRNLSFRVSRSRSKSNSSSFPSSENLSPLRSSTGEDSVYSSFASKLRPINIPNRENPSTFSSLIADHHRHETSSDPSMCSSYMEFTDPLTDKRNHRNTNQTAKFNNFNFEFLNHNSFSETYFNHNTSATPNPSEESGDEPETNFPSAISVQGCGPGTETGFSEKSFQEEEEDAESEFMTSYVIEIEPDKKEDIKEAVDIDETIAWVREKFHTGNREIEGGNKRGTEIWQQNRREVLREKEPFARLETETLAMPDFLARLRKDYGKQRFLTAKAFEEQKRVDSYDETEQLENDMEIELLNEDVKRWSAGKRGNIHSLLSTLQYIVWANSGWHPISLTDITETACVKKAYQKACLCLHPDKLQQKGATPPQKYVAQKVFAILQDAWVAFNSQGVVSG